MTQTSAEPQVTGRRAFRLDAGRTAALSTAKAAWWTLNGVIARAITQPTKGQQAHKVKADAPAPGRTELRRAWMEAFAKDAADVSAGLYPSPERLASPGRAVARAVDFITDALEVDRRRRAGNGVEARAESESPAYPNYYRQNFHYQSGGWFTDDSARRYEAQVEALFSGTAGAMRRRALSLLAKAFRHSDQRGLAIVDVACGAGSFLADLKAAFPRASVVGLDLSAAYLAEAGRKSGATMVQANAERLPFADQSLDGISCIYLFHELPPRVRPVVAAELSRVLKPGGVLAFADSVQTSDAPHLERLLQVFPAFFHEPFYESFQNTDLSALFGAAGLVEEDSDTAFLTRARLYRKRSTQ